MMLAFEMHDGEVPERSKGTDCKSVGSAFEGSNPSLATSVILNLSPKAIFMELRDKADGDNLRFNNANFIGIILDNASTPGYFTSYV